MASKEIRDLAPRALVSRWRRNIDMCGDHHLFLLNNRAKFRAVLSLFKTNKELNKTGEPVFSWIWRLWGTEALMEIRREMDDQAGVINLRSLLYEMEQRPEAMSRRAYLLQVKREYDPDDSERIAEESLRFDTFGIVRTGPVRVLSDHVDPAVVRRDRLELEKVTAKAFRYAQLLIAHRTPLDHLELNMTEADQAIDAITKTLDRYIALLEGGPIYPMTGKLPKNWRRAFKVAWWAPRNQGASKNRARLDDLVL